MMAYKLPKIFAPPFRGCFSVEAYPASEALAIET